MNIIRFVTHNFDLAETLVHDHFTNNVEWQECPDGSYIIAGEPKTTCVRGVLERAKDAVTVIFDHPQSHKVMGDHAQYMAHLPTPPTAEHTVYEAWDAYYKEHPLGLFHPDA